MNIIQKLKEIDACWQATEWAEGKTVAEAWATCHRADWMMFYLSATKKVDVRALTKLKVLIVDQIKDLVFDDDDEKIFNLAKAFANGELDSLDGTHIPKDENYLQAAIRFCAKVGDHLYDCDCIFAAAKAWSFNVDDFSEAKDRFDTFMLQSADIIRAEVQQI